MSAKPSKVYGGTIGSNYQQQGLALAKQFRRDQQYSSSSVPNSKQGESESAFASPRLGEELDLGGDSDDESNRSILSIAFPESSEYTIRAKD
jgi:hypothetical protein